MLLNKKPNKQKKIMDGGVGSFGHDWRKMVVDDNGVWHGRIKFNSSPFGPPLSLAHSDLAT